MWQARVSVPKPDPKAREPSPDRANNSFESLLKVFLTTASGRFWRPSGRFFGGPRAIFFHNPSAPQGGFCTKNTIPYLRFERCQARIPGFYKLAVGLAAERVRRRNRLGRGGEVLVHGVRGLVED